VIVRKAGEIIPEVVRVLPELRPSNTNPSKCPLTAPYAVSQVRPAGEAVTRCVNASCPAILRGAALGQPRCIGYQRHGRKLVQQLVDRSMVQTVADMYDLTPDQLGKYSGWVKVSPEIGGCDRAVKTKPWSRVLYGLGIRHVGSVNAQLLTQRFPRWNT